MRCKRNLGGVLRQQQSHHCGIEIKRSHLRR